MSILRSIEDGYQTARLRNAGAPLLSLLGSLLLLSCPSEAGRREPRTFGGGATEPTANLPRVGEERVGVEETRNGLRLRLVTDLGNVKVLTASSSEQPQVRYKMRIETDARDPDTRKLLKDYSLTVKNSAPGSRLLRLDESVVPWRAVRLGGRERGSVAVLEAPAGALRRLTLTAAGAADAGVTFSACPCRT